MFNKVYVIPTYKCNLNCPHCDLHNIQDDFNEDNFFNTLNNIESKEVILFGGEPLLNKDILIKCLLTNKITSISTNLILLTGEISFILKQFNVEIATSWNPQRFDDNLYAKWIRKLEFLKQYGLSCIVLITLTEDLINLDLNEFLKVLKDIDNTGAVDGIQFEHLVSNNLPKDLHQRADDWLCKLHNHWNFNMKNMIEEQINNWCKDCSNIYTLKPSGNLIKGCPQYSSALICNECLSCQLSKICRPCSLQNTCSFPKHLYELINTNKYNGVNDDNYNRPNNF